MRAGRGKLSGGCSDYFSSNMPSRMVNDFTGGRVRVAIVPQVNHQTLLAYLGHIKRRKCVG